MKTSEEILARYLSEDSEDFFGAQRLCLLCLLPYEMAKPYLRPEYVKAYENDTLPEDERWAGGDNDIKAIILSFLPEFYENLKMPNEIAQFEALLYLKAYIWVADEAFHDELAPLYNEVPLDYGKEIADKIANHFDYKSSIEDVDFEEIPGEPGGVHSEKGE